MIAQKITLNGKIGFLVIVLSIAGFVWTYFMGLRPLEVFIPRISLGLMALGGFLIILKDLIEKPENIEVPAKENILPYLIGIIAAMWIYGWSFRNIGLLTSTFAFLTIWWIWISIRDAKREGNLGSVKFRLVKLVALALAITISVQLLFIELLGMHMPRTLLP